MTAPTSDTLRLACETLAERDVALARAYAEIGLPVWRTTEPVYKSIARTVAYQQISVKAAAAIWERVCSHLGDVTPEAVLAEPLDSLRACGLSRPKIAHMTSIAEAIVTGDLSLSRVLSSPLEAARAELTSVKGIGPWTAEIFLLYSGETDAFPTNDVGLMESHRLLTRAETRLDKKGFEAKGETWRPYRGVAAHLLWGYLHKVREATAAP